MSNEKKGLLNKGLPLPVVESEAKITKEQYLKAMNIDEWSPTQSFRILANIAKGLPLIKACEEEGSTIQSLHFYALHNKEFAGNLKVAKKVKAKIFLDRMDDQVYDLLEKIKNESDTNKQIKWFTSLYKHIERLSLIEDEEQDLRLRQAKALSDEREKVQQSQRQTGQVLEIGPLLKDVGLEFNLDKARVDGPEADEKDQYLEGGKI